MFENILLYLDASNKSFSMQQTPIAMATRHTAHLTGLKGVNQLEIPNSAETQTAVTL